VPKLVAIVDGEDLNQVCHVARPDCVILDLHMAGMNGVAVQRRLKECGLRVPVIMISRTNSAWA
jgi:FixJ family two-component response regulator